MLTGTAFGVNLFACPDTPDVVQQEDYEAFERVLKLAIERVPLPIYAYCIMPNHWHFVVQPNTDTQVTEFFRWMTHTHTMRWLHGFEVKSSY